VSVPALVGWQTKQTEEFPPSVITLGAKTNYILNITFYYTLVYSSASLAIVSPRREAVKNFYAVRRPSTFRVTGAKRLSSVIYLLIIV